MLYFILSWWLLYRGRGSSFAIDVGFLVAREDCQQLHYDRYGFLKFN